MFPIKFSRRKENNVAKLFVGIIVPVVIILFIFALVRISDTNNSEGDVSTATNESVLLEDSFGSPILQSQEIVAGTGHRANQGDIVTVHYTGRLENGAVFDSSIPRNDPYYFELGAGMVIPGWDFGLINVREGSQIILTVPPELAYGSAEDIPGIPPNSTLVFEIEVLDVEKAMQ